MLQTQLRCDDSSYADGYKMKVTERYRNLSGTSRSIFWVILVAMIVVGLIAFFTSETGRTVALLCCGGIVVLVVIGILSEQGMRR